MLIAVSVIAVVASVLALYFRIQLYMMRLRAEYWEKEVKVDSPIRHQWLQASQPKWHRAGHDLDSRE